MRMRTPTSNVALSLLACPFPSSQLLRLLQTAVLPSGERQELCVLQAFHGAETHPALPCPHGLPVHLRGATGRGVGDPETVNRGENPSPLTWLHLEPFPPKEQLAALLLGFPGWFGGRSQLFEGTDWMWGCSSPSRSCPFLPRLASTAWPRRGGEPSSLPQLPARSCPCSPSLCTCSHLVPVS